MRGIGSFWMMSGRGWMYCTVQAGLIWEKIPVRRRLLRWSTGMADAAVAGEAAVIVWGQKSSPKATCSPLFFILINIMNLKNPSLESTHHINFLHSFCNSYWWVPAEWIEMTDKFLCWGSRGRFWSGLHLCNYTISALCMPERVGIQLCFSHWEWAECKE